MTNETDKPETSTAASGRVEPVVMNRYPESLHDRCKYLEKVNKNLREIIELNDSLIASLRAKYHRLCEGIAGLSANDENPRVWFWMGDGYDLTESMVNDLPILIRADQLKELMANGEKIAEDIKDS